MLLSRHPFAEKSGRAFMLRQRIEEIGRCFTPHVVVVGHRGGDASDEGLVFLPLPPPLSVFLNAVRLAKLPLQTWLYYSASLRKAVDTLVAETGAKAIYVDMLRLAPLAAALPREVAFIMDYDDLLSARYERAAGANYDVMGFMSRRVGILAPVARLFARRILAAEAARCRRFERALQRRADVALFTSPREAAGFAGVGASVIGAPPLAEPFASPPAGRRLIFLGNLNYAENITMARALARAAAELQALGEWPNDAVVELVGDHRRELAAEFDPARIRFAGRVDDLRELVGAGVFLAPVMSGSGVKLKVLDGMALGCPVVATPLACEGLAVRPNRDLLVGDDERGVLRVALALRDRQTLKNALARRAQAYLRRAHAPSLGDVVPEAIARAIARASAAQDTL
jgi:glycosyltransferase involved in cell wall biosynthesis